MMDQPQQSLPFADAEAVAAERTNRLSLALARVACDLHLRVLIELIHRADMRGLRLRKTYRELASRPHGLCCSISKVRATITRARTLGLILVEIIETAAGGTAANEFGIDWDGIGRILRGEPRMAAMQQRTADGVATDSRVPSGADPPALIRQGAALTEQGGVLWRQGGVSTEQPPARYGINNSSYTPKFPVPVPEPVPVPGELGLDSRKGKDCTAAVTAKQPPLAALAGLIEVLPELREAAERFLEPLPPRKLIYGVFAPLRAEHLSDTRTMVNWFRRQLGSPDPVCGPSEFELLLILAAAEYTQRTSRAEVRNRVALFCSIVARREWRRALPYIPIARERLEELRSQLQARGTNLNWPEKSDDLTAEHDRRAR